MGRKPTVNLNLPKGMRARRRGERTWYYLDAGGKPRREIPLGEDFALALKKYAELEIDARPQHQDVVTFRYVAERYKKEVIPIKAPRTQKDNDAELERLYKFFDDPPAPLEKIEPQHIRQYLTWRGAAGAKVRANREKALFSHIWNWAREKGYTARANPTAGVKGYSETGRDIYIEEDVLKAVHAEADVPLQETLELMYASGQRPADVRRMQETDLRDGELHIRQGKTAKRLRIRLAGELKAVVDRILARKTALEAAGEHTVRCLALLVTETGQPLTAFMLRGRFDKARKAAIAKARERADEASTVIEREQATQLAAAIARFQLRDLRAKAGTDKTDAQDIRAAQRQLGHTSVTMTEHYVRARRGDKVDPTR